MLGLYIIYIRGTVEHVCVRWQAYLYRVYASNVFVCMFTSAPGHIMDCTEFILGTYTDAVVSMSVHKIIGICGISVAFEGHICCWHIYGNCMVNRVGGYLFIYYMK